VESQATLSRSPQEGEWRGILHSDRETIVFKKLLSATLSETEAMLLGTTERLHAQRRYSVVLLDSLEYLRKNHYFKININVSYRENVESHDCEFYRSAQTWFTDTMSQLYLFKEPTPEWHGRSIELRVNTNRKEEKNFLKYRLSPLHDKSIMIYQTDAMPHVSAVDRHGDGPSIVKNLLKFFEDYDENPESIHRCYRKIRL